MRHIFGCFLSPEKCLPNIVTILKILQLYFLWTNFVADSDDADKNDDAPPLQHKVKEAVKLASDIKVPASQQTTGPQELKENVLVEKEAEEEEEEEEGV